MASVGACLLSNEPDGLAQKMVARRIAGKSWKEIADEFGLGSPSTARAQFKKLTGIGDFKAKGSALKQIAQQLDDIKAGNVKVATQAVKAVDNVDPHPLGTPNVKLLDTPKDIEGKFDSAVKAIDDMYGQDTAQLIYEQLQQGHGYMAISQKTGVNIKDIDQLNWQRLMGNKNGNVWKAYLEKPSSEYGFNAVNLRIGDLRAAGHTVAEINELTDIPETVINAALKGEWKVAGPGSMTPHIPPPPPAPAQVVSMTEPLKSGGNFQYRAKSDWDAWHTQMGPDLSSAELSAIRSYTGSSYHSINSALRQGIGTTSRSVKPLDRAMRPLPFDAKIIRKTGMDAFRDLGVINPDDLLKQAGKVFQDRGYLSTAIEEGHWHGQVKMIIDAPQGTMARWVDPISSNRGERELLLGRETKMIITKVEKLPSPSYGGVNYVLHCQII